MTEPTKKPSKGTQRRAGRQQPVVVHPPRFVPLDKKHKQQALEALRALLVPYFREERARQASQQQALTSAPPSRPPCPYDRPKGAP